MGRWFRSTFTVAVAFLIGVAGLPAFALEAPERELVRSLVAATAAPGVDLDAEVERLEREVDVIVVRLGHGKPSYKRARRLHALLHREYLRSYDRDADTLAGIFDEGAFNCLSASLLFGTVARTLGYPTVALSEPGHLRIRLTVGRRIVDVETTLPDGFDAHRMPWHAEPGRTAASGDAASSALRMPLEAAVGFAWLNRSWHDLDEGAPVQAARDVERALSHLPEEAGQVDLARLLLARAFAVEYDSGRYDAAFEIAAIDAGLFPGLISTRDRLIAAAIKRVERACEADRPTGALEVLDGVRSAIDGTPELRRLQRRTYPGIAAAAVRRAQWDLALDVSERYDAVQPDRLETERLRRWIQSRRNPARAPAPSSADEPPVLVY